MSVLVEILHHMVCLLRLLRLLRLLDNVGTGTVTATTFAGTATT
jgi:hypothetical protein